MNISMINLNEENTCLRRAVYAGLRYAGIVDSCDWIPPSTEPYWLERIHSRYPELEIHRIESNLFLGNKPALIIYYTDTKSDDGAENTHAVFVSDVGPFSSGKFRVYCVISGWENLNNGTF